MTQTSDRSLAQAAFSTLTTPLDWRLDRVGVSVAVHGLTLTAMLYSTVLVPKIIETHSSLHEVVRTLDFRKWQRMPQANSPGPEGAIAREITTFRSDDPGSQSIAHIKAPQTLIQADAMDVNIPIKDVPLPSLSLWFPETKFAKIMPAPEPKSASSSINVEFREASSVMPHSNIEIARPATSASVPSTPAVFQAESSPSASLNAVSIAQPQPTSKLITQTNNPVPNAQIEVPRANQSEQSAPPKSFQPEAAGKPSLPVPAISAQGISDGNAHVVHIVRSRNGEFGMIILGASLEDQYPDMAGVWNGRVSYTASLPVDTEKSWVFQYSAPQGNGTSQQLKAPWPYDIFRPDLSDPMGSDSITIHGFVNQEGRFENLNVLSSIQAERSRRLIEALEKWRFRPASQNDQPVTVEVLILIPEQTR